MKKIIYIAAFLLPLDNFPFMFGGAYRPISLAFFALYLLLNLPNLFKLKFKKLEFLIITIFIGSIFVTFFQNISLNYDHAGVIDAVGALIAGAVTYLSLKIFVQSSKDDQPFISLFKCILRGYGIAVFIGLLQLIYIYIIPSEAISSIISLFVNRSQFVTTRRIHFTFSEPSFIALHMNLIILPAFIVLKKTGNLTKNMKLIVHSFIFMTLFSISIRTYIDTFVFFVLYNIFTTTNKNITKRMIASIGLLFASLLSLNLIFMQNIFNIESHHFNRISYLMTNIDEITNDDSVKVRSTYTKIGLHSFLDKPLIGYGLGNFHYGYINNLHEIPPEDFNYELRNSVNSQTLSQYNMYTRLLSELGLIGLFLMLFTISFILSFKSNNFSKLMIILLAYALIQFDSFAFIPIYFWISMIQSKFIAELKLTKPVRNPKLKKYKIVWSK